MIIDSTPLAHVLAFVGCAILLILWIRFSGSLLGFLYMLIGWALLVACVRSDGNIPDLEHWFLIIGVCGAIVLASYGMLSARRRRMPASVSLKQRQGKRQ
ncbi:MAG TPA: hypothetical protein VF458_20340 [Ktedonobacteraceae bacterium]